MTPLQVGERRRRLLTLTALAGILILAAGLRFYRLTAQSLWNDEGTSVLLAGRSLSQITLSAAADIHPPLYYYLLHYWIALFGSGDAAARSLSALLGVGLVGLTFLLGRRLLGRAAGLLAALWLAASPYQVYYSQEARMYMLLACLGTASLYLFHAGWLAPGPRRRWAMAGWVVVTALAAYTHYLAAGIVLAENVAWLANLPPALREGKDGRRRLWPRALTWAAAQALVGLLYLSWLRLTWAQLHRWPAVSEPFGLLELLRRALPLFALGPSVEPGTLTGLALAVLAVAFLGLAWPGRHARGARLLALAGWLMPVALLYYLSRSRPVYHPKFLLLATPGLALLLARGVTSLFGPDSAPARSKSPLPPEGEGRDIGGNSSRTWRAAGVENPSPCPLPRAVLDLNHSSAGEGRVPTEAWPLSGAGRTSRWDSAGEGLGWGPRSGEQASPPAKLPPIPWPSPSQGRGGSLTCSPLNPMRGLLAWLRAGAGVAAAVLIIAAGIPGLRNYYYNPRFARDDYRGMAQYISAMGRDSDIVLINAPSQIETFSRYYSGPLPVIPIPLQRPPDREETIGRLEELTRDARHVYGVFWATDESDPERIVESWLDAHAYKALDAWYGNVRLVAYALPTTAGAGEVRQPLDVQLGESIRLRGYTLAAEEVAAGDILQLTLHWEAAGAISRRYKVFTHVIDAAGHLIAGRDAEPVAGTSLTDTWQPGRQVIDRYGLSIPHGTAPGEYVVEVGMYGLDDGLRLPIAVDGAPVGDSLILQEVRVTRPSVPPPAAALGMQEQRTIEGRTMRLLGFSFGRAGALDQGRQPLHPGEVAELVLFWQALAPQGGQQVHLRIVDSAGRTRLDQATPPTGGLYPTENWQPQEVVRDSLHLPLPPDLPPGRYRLLLGWEGTTAQAEAPLTELLAFVVE